MSASRGGSHCAVTRRCDRIVVPGLCAGVRLVDHCTTILEHAHSARAERPGQPGVCEAAAHAHRGVRSRAMAASQLELMPGEHMILSGNPHWWYFWKQVAAGVGVLALLFLRWTIDIDWSRHPPRLARRGGLRRLGADTIYEFVQWRTTRFAVTDQRVAYQSGVIRRAGVSIPSTGSTTSTSNSR